MDFKFIVLALVISVAAGEAENKLESPLARTNISIASNINEGLPNAKDDITLKNNEKLTHDIVNIAVGTPNNDLSHKPIADIQMTAIDIDMTPTSRTTAPTPAGTPAPTSAPPPSSATAPTPAPPSKSSSASATVPTPAPTSTPTPVSTAVPTPAPVAFESMVPQGPEEGKWIVNDTNSVCIVIQMEIKFNVSYPGKENSAYNQTIYVPKNSTATGHCGKSAQDITLNWGLGNVFNISFTRNETTQKFHIQSLNLTVNTTDFKNIRDDIKNLTYTSNKPDFPVIPLKMSYKCDKQLKQILRASDNYNTTMLISHTQLQAFMDNKTVFGEVKDCDDFDTPDIVPIAVGSVLSLLVIIVLAAYLIGRRRSQSRGYLSM